MKTNLILDRFAKVHLRSSTLVSALKNKKKNYFSGLKKTISTIMDYMADLLHSFLEEKTVSKMWSILESRF